MPNFCNVGAQHGRREPCERAHEASGSRVRPAERRVVAELVANGKADPETLYALAVRISNGGVSARRHDHTIELYGSSEAVWRALAGCELFGGARRRRDPVPIGTVLFAAPIPALNDGMRPPERRRCPDGSKTE